MKLSKSINEYLTYRYAMGAKLQAQSNTLRLFLKFIGKDIDIEHVLPEKVRLFIFDRQPITSYAFDKHSVLNCFYRFAITRGHVRNSPVPESLPKKPPSFVPYIYSRRDLKRLLKTIQRVNNPNKDIDAVTGRAIILTLYGAALRISEAISLRVKDVDFENNLLTIRDSKFHKSRLVPIGPELKKELSQYVKNSSGRGTRKNADDYFFIGRSAAMIKRWAVELYFQELRSIAKVSRDDGARYQPRLHDFRHTAAVHRVTAWYKRGADVQRLLPLLSTYLGHVHLAETQVYLTMTPELLKLANSRFETYASANEVEHA